MSGDRLRSWMRPGEFGIPGIKVSLVVGIAAALILRLVGIGPLWLTVIVAPIVVFVLSVATDRKLKGADSPRSARGGWPGVTGGRWPGVTGANPLFVVDQSQVKAEAFIVETAKTRSEELGDACTRWGIRGCAPTGSTIRAVGS